MSVHITLILIIINIKIILSTTTVTTSSSGTGGTNGGGITTNSSQDIVSQYSLPDNLNFQHIIYDKYNTHIYAGATNRIIKFSADNLTVVQKSITGPKQDSPLCHAGGCPEDIETMEINNYNKILIFNPHGDTLIACGSIHQGACVIYNNLKQFPDTSKYIDIPLAANDENSTTYAFIGPSKYSDWDKDDLLYVGTTFTNFGDYRHDVPAISSRRLTDLNFGEYSIQQSVINIDVKYRDHFLVNYVYGFNSSEYAYFIIVQKKSHLADEAGYITRLARICKTDINYDSYTEITMTCLAPITSTSFTQSATKTSPTSSTTASTTFSRIVSGSGDDDSDYEDYNILRDAKITKAGPRLAQKLHIKKDDLILVTVFSPSKEITNEPQQQSAMCIYSLQEIDTSFDENIHMCFNGTVKDRNLGYISGTINDGKCPVHVGSTGNIGNYCDVGLKISGTSPIIAKSAFVFDNESITSVTTAITGLHTLAFLGTIDGAVKKVIISGPTAGEYDKIVVDNGNPILPDTMLSPKQDYLYVLSNKRLTKMRVEHCSIYPNCSSCLESRDPFCGWCSLEKRCTIRNACQKDTSASRWLSLSYGQQCIDFEMVLPDKIPINQMTTVHLIIRTLPELPSNAKYKCVFGNSTPIDANVTDNGLSCQTPPIKLRPIIDINQDHILVPLSVRSSETNKDFVSRSFAFYDCSRHETCKRCVQSEWSCNWCIYDNKCVHNTTTCRNTGNVVSVENSCPHFKRTSQPILLPNKVPKEIKLEFENLPRPQSAHTGFLCTVNIEGANMVLPARVEKNRFIVCENTPYSYEANTNEYEAKVDVNWNRNHYIDTVSIILYKCDILGSHREHADCSLCVTRDPKYNCTWCNNQCVYNESCAYGNANECPKPRIDMIKPLSGPIEGGTLITIEGSNLGIREEDVRGKIRIGDIPCELVNYEISVKIECRTGSVSYELTAPIKVGNDAGYTESSVQFQYRDIKLNGLYPTIGPQSGGTKLSIIGKYLNIGTNIVAFLDSYMCEINITQTSSSRLTCITSAARSPEHIRKLTLVIDGANRTLQCQTDKSNSNNNNNLYSSQYHSQYDTCSIYNYTVDPKIMQIKPLKSFVSGGRMVTVHGTHLDSIQKPEIEVWFQNERVNKSTCLVLNSNQMECPSPSVNSKFYTHFHKKSIERSNKRRRNLYDQQQEYQQQQQQAVSSSYGNGLTTISSTIYTTNNYGGSSTGVLQNSETTPFKIHESQLNFQISFIMDNVQSVKDLNKYFQTLRSSIIYVDDPIFFPFSNSIKLYKGDTLVIEGENLNIASDESDVNVTIGMMQCNVTSLALTQLVCTPPEQQPLPTDENGIETTSELPLVVVRVGRTLRYPIGYLKYDLLKPYTISHAMTGIAIGTIIVVILLIIILIVYRRKSTQAEREYKRIQIQMDTLESNVRLECKQAFAELQTDMTDLTADLENSGIPTLDHINYIMKVFFPGVQDHPILNLQNKLNRQLQFQHMQRQQHLQQQSQIPQQPLPPQSANSYDTAMLQFEQLINNKTFLLMFIDILEIQKSFNIRDKVNVASLLMIVLMNKMEYATDILKSLLLRLIDKSVVTKHPQLMLRRTESVVEKMLTNYMAICMYDYLKDYSGASLFLLYKAIKHQIEKGLVDYITNDARYSLSEDRLLREQIDHVFITLHILQDDLDEKIQCKVLDRDTITQVKSKILDALFKNTPFSLRPSVHDVDLEWRHGRGGHLTLQDEDLTTKVVNGWKRLNTLAHYGVKESAVMSLIAKQSPINDNYNNLNNIKTTQSTGSYHTPNCYYINNAQTIPSHHLIINNNGELENSGLQQQQHHHQLPIHNHNHHNINLNTLQQNHHNLMQQQHQQVQQQQQQQARVYHLVKPNVNDDHYINIKTNSSSTGNNTSTLHHNQNHFNNNNNNPSIIGAGSSTNSTTSSSSNNTERTHTAIREIYLTRLLATKGTIQKFVYDFFVIILTVNNELPPAVKWLFDLLDDAALRHGINDPEVVHAWKSNSLPLRFWVNFIKNPDFIFDINKTPTVDACLSVIAQTFMDACSTNEHRLGKDSPSNKLLFAKDLPQYREMVTQFYSDISRLPQISDQDMCTAMHQLSIQQTDEFDTIAALKELYIYVTKYRTQIMDALEMDVNCKKMHLAHKLKNVACTLEGDETSAC